MPAKKETPKKLVEFDPFMEHDLRNKINDLSNLRNERPLKMEYVLGDFVNLDCLRDVVYDAIEDYVHDAVIEAFDHAAEQTAEFYA